MPRCPTARTKRCRPAAASARCRPRLSARAMPAPSTIGSSLSQRFRLRTPILPVLGTFSVSLVPKRIDLKGLTAHHAVAGLEAGGNTREADLAPRRDRNLAMLEGAGADLDE